MKDVKISCKKKYFESTCHIIFVNVGIFKEPVNVNVNVNG